MTRARRVAAAAVLALAVTGVGGCDDDESSLAPAVGVSPSPEVSAATSTPSPTIGAVVDLDTAALAATTSRAGRVRFRTDILPSPTADRPELRLEGIVDWAEGAGYLVQSQDDGVQVGKESTGLVAEYELWVLHDRVWQGRVTPNGSRTDQPFRRPGSLVQLVGIGLGNDGVTGPVAAENALRGLLENQTFTVGPVETVDDVPARRYIGTPDDPEKFPTDVWVDDGGRIVRLLGRPRDTDEYQQAARTTFSAFGTDQEIPERPRS